MVKTQDALLVLVLVLALLSPSQPEFDEYEFGLDVLL